MSINVMAQVFKGGKPRGPLAIMPGLKQALEGSTTVDSVPPPGVHAGLENELGIPRLDPGRVAFLRPPVSFSAHAEEEIRASRQRRPTGFMGDSRAVHALARNRGALYVMRMLVFSLKIGLAFGVGLAILALL